MLITGNCLTYMTCWAEFYHQLPKNSYWQTMKQINYIKPQDTWLRCDCMWVIHIDFAIIRHSNCGCLDMCACMHACMHLRLTNCFLKLHVHSYHRWLPRETSHKDRYDSDSNPGPEGLQHNVQSYQSNQSRINLSNQADKNVTAKMIHMKTSSELYKLIILDIKWSTTVERNMSKNK